MVERYPIPKNLVVRNMAGQSRHSRYFLLDTSGLRKTWNRVELNNMLNHTCLVIFSRDRSRRRQLWPTKSATNFEKIIKQLKHVLSCPTCAPNAHVDLCVPFTTLRCANSLGYEIKNERVERSAAVPELIMRSCSRPYSKMFAHVVRRPRNSSRAHR